jgi:hypothetical protein
MKREELKQELDKLSIPESYYSLYDSLEPDRIILYHSYHEWQVFYLDERGGRNEYRVFYSEEEACNYIYEQFKSLKQTSEKFNFDL